jgi:hypothetical protein
MQFESRIGRTFLTTAVLGLVPDSLIGAAAAYVTGTGLVGFFVRVLGLQFLYLVLFLRRACNSPACQARDSMIIGLFAWAMIDRSSGGQPQRFLHERFPEIQETFDNVL